jgi:hypothetical protein
MTEKEIAKMTDMMNNMANMMAEDSGLFELRNPEFSGMRKKGLVARLIGLVRR